MKLTLRAPIELENLLPYDIKFRIHDKNTSLSSSNFLVKGGASPIHTVELSHLLLLSVAPEDTSKWSHPVMSRAADFFQTSSRATMPSSIPTTPSFPSNTTFTLRISAISSSI